MHLLMSGWSRYLSFVWVSQFCLLRKRCEWFSHLWKILLGALQLYFCKRINSAVHQKKTKPHLFTFVLFYITIWWNVSNAFSFFLQRIHSTFRFKWNSSMWNAHKMQNKCTDNFCGIFIQFSFLSFLIDFYLIRIFRRFFQMNSIWIFFFDIN